MTKFPFTTSNYRDYDLTTEVYTEIVKASA
jgi:hypothetical protein